MRNVTFAPEALNDLAGIKEDIVVRYGSKIADKIIREIIKDIKRLIRYPDTDIKLFERFGIETDYRCIHSNKNYIFYRIEEKSVRVIRVLNEKRDFLYVFFGIRMSSEKSEDYWGEE